MKQKATPARTNRPSKDADSHLRILYWNAGGLNSSKLSELKANIAKFDADIVFIIEAGASTDNTCYFQVPDYSLFLIKRSRQIASGIIVYVRNSIASKDTIIHEMNNQDKLEAICIDAWKNGIHFKVIGLYNPPNNLPNLDSIASISNHRNTIIVGDFNAHSTRWNYSTTSVTGKAVEELLDNSALIRISSGPTFLSYAGHTSTPDLALVHANLSPRSALTLEDPVDGCGHRLMYLRIHYKSKEPAPRRLTRWNFKRAQWDKYSKLTDSFVTEDLVDGNPDASAELFVKAMLRAAEKSIPKGQVKNYKPFWCKSLDTLKAERNEARRVAENSHDIRDCILLRKAQAKLKHTIILSKRAAYRSFAAKLDFRKDGPKAHKFISCLNNEKSSRHWEPITLNGKLLSSPKEVATALCKNYASVSRLHISAKDRKLITNKGVPSCQNEQDYLLFNEKFSLNELLLAISTLKKGKSAGPDGIFPELITNLGPLALKTFLKLINLTWNTRVPHQWRKAEVISLLKKGKPSNKLNSYRPISLTSVCCKVAEKMVEQRLREYLESTGAISDCQAGFRRYRSTVDQVMKLTQAVKDGFHRRQSTLAVLVDFRAAYDKVWRHMLLHKLKKQGVNGNMLNWIKSFLSQRNIRCKFLDATSPYKLMRQGLPQGAVLSCPLFNIMINDLQCAIQKTQGVTCLFFADDVLIWATGSNVSELEEALNNSLLNLATWADLNKMEVSAEKTVAQLFTMSTKDHHFNLKYKGLNLKRVSLSRYLGINLDTKLHWATHIRDTAEKANKRLNIMKRLTATTWGATQEMLATTYKTYIRPLLDYGCEVTSLASKTNLERYDVVQNNALRIITGGAKSTPIAAMQLQTGIEPLDRRQDKFTLRFWERARRVDRNYWSDYTCATQRLKTQTSPMARAESLMRKYQLPLSVNSSRAPLQHFTTVVSALPSTQLDLIGLTSSKSDTIPDELKSSALETIHTRYPTFEWLHIYTDGSCLSGGAGAGWFCHLFEGTVAVGKNATNFDGEVCAIHEASSQLLATDLAPARVVFLIDSQAAILALGSNAPTDCLRTIQCRTKLAELISRGWVVVLQWVPGHVGIPGNERADAKAKQGAESSQPDLPMTLTRAKNLINISVKYATTENLQNACSGKKWETLATVGPIPRHLERAEAVARFRLATGHDYLGVHLHRIGLAESESCPLCGQARMDGDHLLDCSHLDNYATDDLVGRYWEARRAMVQKPSTGVG